jgi:filamentous hemagglutinin family protein
MGRTGFDVLHRILLATSCLVAAPLIAASSALAGGPSGGTVVVGHATVTAPSNTSTVVTQTSNKALINWNSFSVSAGSTVTFDQPNSKSITVNRVTGSSASSIYGDLLANGRIWLINANGILFGRGSEINVGALIATTSDITDQDFRKGRYNFGKASSNAAASVVNQGTIRASDHGSVVLSGASVSNQGIIQADLGTVVLGGADAFTVDLTGDNLIRYQVTAPVSKTPVVAGGSPAAALVSNSGTIAANGGKVLMTARAARSVEDSVINNSGIIEATSVSSHNGEIDLDAGPDGTVNVGGTLDASGKGAGQTGGTVAMTGGTVNVANGTRIDASGDSGGGGVRIGGDFHGKGPLPDASRTNIGTATIDVDAITKGNGGTVAVWSNNDTNFSGTISAKGGARGGNGGFVETSGGNLQVGLSGFVDTSATAGKTGSWLLDPANIVIATGGTTTLSSGDLGLGTDPGLTDTIAPSTITNALQAGTDVLLEASNDITVSNDVIYSSSNNLSLLAENSIEVDANIQNTMASGGGAINLIAGWNGTTLPPSSLTAPGVFGANGGSIIIGGENASGNVAIGSASGTTTLAGDNITLDAQKGHAQVGFNGAGTGDIIVDATGAVALTGTGCGYCYAQIGNGGVFVAGDKAGAITVNAGNDVSLTGGGSDYSYAQIGNGGDSSPGNTSGDIVVNAGGSVLLTGGGDYVEIGNGGWGAPGNGGGNVTVNAAADVTLTGAAVSSFGYAQIGNGSQASSGSDSGDINVTAGGALTLTSGGVADYVQIGNGAADGSFSGNVTGDINVNVGGASTFEDGAGGQAWLGNVAGEGATETGNVTLVTNSGFVPASFIVADLGSAPGTGGNVTIGFTTGSDIFLGGVNYSSPNDFTFLVGGNLNVTDSVTNSGTGALTLVAGWDGHTLGSASQLRSAGAYGANDAVVTIGGENANGNVDVGSAGGTTTLLSGALTIEADNGFAQLGYHGSGGSDVDVDLMGDLTLTGNSASPADYAQIGNGDATGTNAFIGSVTGNLSLDVGGTITFDGFSGESGGTAWLGNVAGTEGTSPIESGNVTLIAASENDNGGANLGDMIGADLGSSASSGSGGNVTVGFTDPQDGATVVSHAGIGNSPNSLTVLSTGSIYLSASLENQGTGSLTLVSGWNPSVISPHDVINTANADGSLVALFTGSAGSYGQNGGSVGIGGPDAVGNVSVGSAGGTTTVLADNVTLDAANGYAQLGFNGASGGDITLVAQDALTLTGGAPGANIAQIGNGSSFDNSSAGGNISLTAQTVAISGSADVAGNSADIVLTGEGAAVGTGTYPLQVAVNDLAVQTNGGSAYISAPTQGLSIGVGEEGIDLGGGDLVLVADGPVTQSDAITAGSANVSTTNGAITLTNTGNTFNAATLSTSGTDDASLYDVSALTIAGATISGTLTLSSGGAIGQSGAITANALNVTTTNGAITLTNASNAFATATLSTSGSDDASLADASALTIAGATVGGDLTLSGGGAIGQSGAVTANALNVTTTNGAITLTNAGNAFGTATLSTSGSDDASLADASNLTIAGATIGGDLTLSGGGTIGQSGAISASGLNVTGSSITLTDATNAVASANLATAGDASLYDSTNLTLTSATVGGDLTLLTKGGLTFASSVQLTTGALLAVAGWDGTTTDPAALAVAGAYGNYAGSIVIGGAGAKGNVAVGSAGGATMLAGDNVSLVAQGGFAQLGFNGSSSGNIDVYASGAVTLTGGGATGDYAQIGNGGYKASGNASGTINVAAAGAVALTGGSGQEAYAQIGDGGAESNADGAGYSNSAIITVSGETVTLGAGTSDASYAQIGNGGYKAGEGLTGGTATNSGDITVNAVESVSMSGNGKDAYAQIGNGGDQVNTNAAAGASGANSGDIVVSVSDIAHGSVDLTAGTGADSYAQIGNGGYSSDAPTSAAAGSFTDSGPITASDLALVGSDAGANGYAQIGNGDASLAGVGDVSGDIIITSPNAVTLTKGTASNAPAMIGGATGKGTVTGTITGYTPSSSSGSQQQTSAISALSTQPSTPSGGGTNIVIASPLLPPQDSNASGTGLTDNTTAAPSPLQQMADASDNGDSGYEETQPSDTVTVTLGKSLNGGPSGQGKSGTTVTHTIIPGMLKQVVMVGANTPHGVPPADQDYSSWGNEAFWQW